MLKLKSVFTTIWLPSLLAVCIAMTSLFVVALNVQAESQGHHCEKPAPKNGNEMVKVCVWIDTGNGNIRAGGLMSATNNRIHVQIDKINLGTENGVIATTPGPKNSQGGDIPDYYTKSVKEVCGPYHARLYYSIRWSNGTLLANQSTDLTPWYSRCPI